MTTPHKPRTYVRLPWPRGAHKDRRVQLVIIMHPTQLDALRVRAESASMSLTGYVAALLESDAEDIVEVGAGFSAREIASVPELLGARVNRGIPAELTGQVVEAVAQVLAARPINELGFTERQEHERPHARCRHGELLASCGACERG